MKFAKELETDLVPEWRLKYLNYKLGKKKLKAVSRALRNANRSPATPVKPSSASIRRRQSLFRPSPLARSQTNDDINQPNDISTIVTRGTLPQAPPARPHVLVRAHSRYVDEPDHAAPIDIEHQKARGGGASSAEEQNIVGHDERTPLFDRSTDPFKQGRMVRYGSIIGSPPRYGEETVERQSREDTDLARASTLDLPQPALSATNSTRPSLDDENDTVGPLDEGPSKLPPSPEAPKSKHPTFRRLLGGSVGRRASAPVPQPEGGSPGLEQGNKQSIRRLSSFALPSSAASPKASDAQLESFRVLQLRQDDFFHFLDCELYKIEAFYKEKEEEATRRLQILRNQLHTLRNQREEELYTMQNHKHKHRPHWSPHQSHNASKANAQDMETLSRSASLFSPQERDALEASAPWWLRSLSTAGQLWGRYVQGKPDPNAGANNEPSMQNLGTPTNALIQRAIDTHRDYTRRPTSSSTPYRTAKRKLKQALAEYYRGLELLKSYALLNHTAFRKINKKYDKTVTARPQLRYMADKVNSAHFVTSDLPDAYMHDIEDLYARYFEQGNRKVAVGKLRSKTAMAGDFTMSSFGCGLLGALGFAFAGEACYYASRILHNTTGPIHESTSYLLQLYGGYFLIIWLILLWCIDCWIWNRAKVNYAFVFEFDARHHRDWRELGCFTCLFIFLLGVTMELNFRFNTGAMFLYWPVVLISVSLVILFLPLPIFYHHTRRWFLYSNWRLFFSGLYPVEFRDFFFGDQYCSQTYAIGNVELFFCLYAHHYNQPQQCNSSYSRLLGFFTTLPGIWRALQCIRRYRDTKNFFPHLVNCGKYICTMTYYMTLSLYRIHRTPHMKAIFIVFASINAVYCTSWDIILDFSLGKPNAYWPFTRDVLAFKHVWIYYSIMLIDVILRFNWIFYALYTQDLQHSTIVAFLVGFSECCRRGLWTILRVENEHCTNVGRFRASRDVPLPYKVPVDLQSPSMPSTPKKKTLSPAQVANGKARATDLEGSPHSSPAHRTTLQAAVAAGADIEAQRTRTRDSTTSATAPSPAVASLRRRSFVPSPSSPLVRGLTRVGTALHVAHAQDFERRKRPEVGEGHESDDDDDLEIEAARAQLKRVQDAEGADGGANGAPPI